MEATAKVPQTETTPISDTDCLKNLLTQIQAIKPMHPKAGEAQSIVEEVVTTLEEAESIIKNYLDKFCPE
jgi:DNA repair ATPase RecN